MKQSHLPGKQGLRVTADEELSVFNPSREIHAAKTSKKQCLGSWFIGGTTSGQKFRGQPRAVSSFFSPFLQRRRLLSGEQPRKRSSRRQFRNSIRPANYLIIYLPSSFHRIIPHGKFHSLSRPYQHATGRLYRLPGRLIVY